ncbi:MAG: cell envelope biogenesis protein OmpA, partial [Rhizobiaceae bacterium]
MKKTVIAALAGTLAVTACTSDPYTGEPTVSNTLDGAAIGAAAGAGLG